MIALQVAHTVFAQQRSLLGGLDAFSDRGKAKASCQVEQVPQDDAVLAPGSKTADKSAVDFDDIDLQCLEMAQRGVPSAKIIEGHPAASISERVDEMRQLANIVERCRLGDLDHKPRGAIWPIAQQRDQRAQPWPIASGSSGDVEAEPDRVMSGKFGKCPVQDVTVDQADEPGF